MQTIITTLEISQSVFDEVTSLPSAPKARTNIAQAAGLGINARINAT